MQDGKSAWADASGTADAITAAYSIPITALVDGQLCYVRASAANATTTPNFSPDSLTARTIVKNGGVALAAGDIVGDGHELELRYDLANTRWELMNPASNIGAGSITNAMLADMAANTVKVRAASTSGVPSDLALSASQLLGRGSTGDIAPITLGGNLSMSGTTLSGGFTLGTEQATTSGTTIDFTGIPATAKYIALSFEGVSTSGANVLLVQIGDAGGVETSGYISAGEFRVSGVAPSSTTNTGGFLINAPNAANTLHGVFEIFLKNSTTNTWAAKHDLSAISANILFSGSGTKPLSATLDRVRIATTGGDTFDAGSINIMWG